MRKLITINKNELISIPNKVQSILDPNYIYVPLPNDVLIDEDITNALINQIIYEDSKYSYTSSISGKVTGIIEKTINNKKISCLEIKNDFKERKKKNNKSVKITTKDELLLFLDKLHLFKLKDKLNCKGTNLIINGIIDEPYVYNQTTYLSNFGDEILDTADYLSRILGIDNIIVALKNVDSENINSFISIIGTYTNVKIKLLEDKYLLGNDYFLTETLNLKLKESIVFNPAEIYELYNVIKYNKKSDTKYISIINIPNNKNYIINVKLYTSINEVFEHLKLKIKDNQIIVKNGLLTGVQVPLENEVITPDSESFYIIDNMEHEEKKCINCGKCYQVCPIKVNPKYCMDYNKKSKNCLDCGLCSYICPSYINLRKYLKGDKSE